MKRSIFAATALSLLCAAVAFAAPTPELQPLKHGQCYTPEDHFVKDVENAGGGFGTLFGIFPFRREQALEDDAIKEIGWVTLKRGSFAGNHLHKDNEDAYIVISGKGIFTDGEGNAWVVGPGDITMARPGQSHGMANIYDEDLVFLDIIAKNSAANLDAIAANPTPQMFPKSALFDKDVEKAGGGKGTLYGKFSFRREQATDDQAIKEIGWMTLKKGDSIGLHQHVDNDDAYIIVSGTGVFTDGNGKETVVGPRSVTIAGPGESHALRNDSDEDLIFIDLIAKNHALAVNVK